MAADLISPISPSRANVDTEQVFVIPGDTTGTWLTDTGIGLIVGISDCVWFDIFLGSTGWQAGNFFVYICRRPMVWRISVQCFELFDVGLYSTRSPPALRRHG